ncbi:thioesterase II family protein [Pseudonocardia endophytica]|uniref:Medium-chain acyl-[acyl-carrier-protein] hydrolase n=1 Tax=Pseudonocardia endophytica TaxID=401976 RepID=A0A4R1HR91_PSEEN|nr:alpha/beta fold hydrolase [Pseudonocardia endophytica]TCK22289.1 medium-chain acyl-[acyl-carrier-protein] hydrolase [Pseudonocardia endophytica]
MSAPTTVASPWLPFHKGQSGLPLFCLPHAGGSASAYRPWQGGIPGVAVLPVQPPGRESRLAEPGHATMTTLVDELATVVLDAAGGEPYAVYGHSLGALVAFELLREIRRRGGTGPVTAIVSGCVAPQCVTEDRTGVGTMTTAELVEMLRRLGGTPSWLLDDPACLDMILPAVRADFGVKESYAYRPEPPLDLPVTVLSSDADPRATDAQQRRWSEQTTSSCTVRTLTGGHFAVLEQRDTARRHLSEALSTWA